MVTITVHCPRLRDATLWCAMDVPPIANSSIAAVRTSKPRESHSPRLSASSPRGGPARKRKNAAVCVASHARLGSLAPPCPHGSKKVAQLPLLRATLLAPDPEDPTSTILELNERMARLCSKKRTTPGCGIALCRKSRQVVAYAVGDHRKKTCQLKRCDVLFGPLVGCKSNKK